jgi:hypothetical protein
VKWPPAWELSVEGPVEFCVGGCEEKELIVREWLRRQECMSDI